MSINPRQALIGSLTLGTLLQTTMVVAGHFVPAVALFFGPLGITISFLAGALYSVWARPGKLEGARAGGIVGGGCALVGIAISWALGDVTALLLILGTASSAVTGLLGGLAGRLLPSPAAHRA